MTTRTDEDRAKARARYAANAERYKDYHRVWREKNKGRIAAYRADERRNKTVAYFMRETRNRALKQGVEFGLTPELLERLLEPMVCAATGLPLSWDWEGATRSNPWAPSLDRIRPGEGYVPDNVRVVCWLFNASKLDWSEELLLTLARAIVERADRE